MRRQEKENAQQLNLQAANNVEDDGSNDDADNDTEELVDTAENKQQTTLQAAANNAPDTTTLAQRVIKIQFHLQNIANSAIIIGQELIECKKEVGHGNWQNWLKDNFSMTYRTAKNFMDIADRFGSLSNSQEVKSISLLNSTQLIALLALPAGEEENFIAEKAAEGNPVEKMTVKQEREEIKKYKAKIEKLEKDNKQLTDVAHTLRLENEALKDQEPQVIETVKTITPPDYVATVQRAEELQESVNSLLAQKEDAQKTIEDLQNQVIEAVSKQSEPPADYLQLEKKLSDMQFELADAKSEARNAKEILAAEKDIEQLFKSAAALNNSIHYHTALKNYMQKHPNTKDKIGMLRCIYEQLDSACTSILEKTK